jgi:hypothetical protein
MLVSTILSSFFVRSSTAGLAAAAAAAAAAVAAVEGA